MAKIDLTSLEWRELVFQGKNKGYGAYQMRGESSKRHNRAMIIVTVIALIAISLPTVMEMVKPEEREIVTEVTTLSQLSKPAEVKNDIKKEGPVEPPPALKSSVKFTAPVIKKDEEVSESEEIKSQDELSMAKGSISIADVKGNDETYGVDIADVKQKVSEDVEEKVYDIIEQMPEFPGGEEELMKYLSTHIKYPLISQENGIQGRVVLGFIVSKTGLISDVTVLRSLDAACDREAIRVVKTLPRWIPGKQNGETVNVRYTLPVAFTLH